MDVSVLAVDSDDESGEFTLYGENAFVAGSAEELMQCNRSAKFVHEKQSVVARLKCFGGCFAGVSFDCFFSIWNRYEKPSKISLSETSFSRSSAFKAPLVKKTRSVRLMNERKMPNCSLRISSIAHDASFGTKKYLSALNCEETNASGGTTANEEYASRLYTEEERSSGTTTTDRDSLSDYFHPHCIFKDDDYSSSIRKDSFLSSHLKKDRNASEVKNHVTYRSTETALGTVVAKHTELTEKKFINWERDFYPRLFYP